tara:strand:+ start:1649 stop:2122 length:474 start_codon:yes stop_codon:yes gene_type:complete
MIRWLVEIAKHAIDRRTSGERSASEVPETILATHQAALSPKTGAPRISAMLGLWCLEELEDVAMLKAAANRKKLRIVRTSPTLVVRYTMGACNQMDREACIVAGCDMQCGWIFEIRQRQTKNFIADDVYWYVPDGTSLRIYRSRAELSRAGLIDHLS